MSMDLETIAVRRAAEQLEAGAWRRPEAEPEKPIRECLVVGCHNEPSHGRRICDACRLAGFVGGECRSCGGPLKRTDQHGPKGDRRNCCATCRAEMEQTLTGFGTAVHRMVRDRFGRVKKIRRQPKPEAIARTRAKLAAKGIHVTAGLNPAMEGAEI